VRNPHHVPEGFSTIPPFLGQNSNISENRCNILSEAGYPGLDLAIFERAGMARLPLAYAPWSRAKGIFLLMRKEFFFMGIDRLGAVIFGLAVGWLACRLLWQKTTTSWTHTIIALGGIVAAAAVLAPFGDAMLFSWYAIGLVLMLLAFIVLRIALPGNQRRQPWRETLVGLVPAAAVSASTAAVLPEDRHPEEPALTAASVAEPPMMAAAADTSTDPDPADIPTMIRPAVSPTEAEPRPQRTRGSKRSTAQKKSATDE
jgi:hypothetical protein